MSRSLPRFAREERKSLASDRLSKTAALCAGLIALAAASAHAQPCAGSPSGAKLNIVVEGVRSAKGLMTASLYPDDASQFLKANGALKVWRDPAAAPSQTMCIWLTHPGNYAVAVYHDANSNHRWDHSMFGIEGFGFSNNPKVAFSQPSYASARFAAKAGETTVRVRLRYP